MASYKVRVEVLSPLHIGDGQRLWRNIDFVSANNRTLILNIDRFTHWAYDSQTSNKWMEQRPGDVLGGYSDLESLQLHRYILAGQPLRNELRSHIKTVYGNAYLPGSTLKGMLRNIFVWGLYAARDRKPDLNRLGKNRSWAGQPVEREVMGANPNLDLFRAIHVSDSQPLPLDALSVRSVDIYPTTRQGQGGVMVDIEAVREGSVFEASLHVDTFGFSDQAADELGWKGKKRWVTPETLVSLGKAFAEQRIQQEVDYYTNLDELKIVGNFYRTRLVDLFNRLSDNQFLAQIGWGTGWNSKTLNTLVNEDRVQFAKIARAYKLTRNSNSFNEKTRFPKSRQIMRHEGRPVRPMGWVLVTIE